MFLTVAFVANDFNLKGISIETAKIASDKLLMKKNFEENNVKIFKFEEIFGDDLKALFKA
tara:strand:- start:3045 stop:3224 length:180 start_codon:yes stop_codon:yes gene_type:complete